MQRHQLIERFGGDHDPGRMDAEGFVGSLNAHRQVDPMAHLLVVFVLLAKVGVGGIGADHFGQLGWLSPSYGDQFRQSVGFAVGNVEHPGYILEHRLGGHAVEGDDLGDFVFAVALGHIVDDLATAGDAEVRVDIRHRLAFWVEEALEQQSVLHRINGRDAQGPGHHRPRRRTPPRSHRYPLLPGKADVIPHHQKVGGKAHLLHHLQLELQTFAVCRFDGSRGVQAQALP